MINSIIVPVRNGLEYTKAAVESFFAQDVGSISVVIVDNDLSREHYQWYSGLMEAEEPARVCPLVNHEPKSVAASWNMGLNAVWRIADYAMVANNDLILRPDTYRHLLADGGGFVTAVGVTERTKILPHKVLQHDAACVCGHAVIIHAPHCTFGSSVIGSGIGHKGTCPCAEFRAAPGVASIDYYPTPDPSARRPHPDFSCYLIRKWVYDRVGPFDEKFEGAFCEDWDYHVRLHRAGVEAYCIDLPFWHFGSQTIKNSPSDQADAIARQADRNREYFFRKWGFRGATAEYYAQFSPDNFGVDEAARHGR